ncbi:hypothetical protein AB4Y32_29430 [Paraburkholderia phymatum]|uniref:Uncharacterized protein n=1 Tax=Paraburkholderia phymatum TaxID=148447 RepID=A0ACC6U855_9BURK
MSKNPPTLITFTPEELREHDLDVAMEAQQIVAGHLVHNFNDMKPAQMVRRRGKKGKMCSP